MRGARSEKGRDKRRGERERRRICAGQSHLSKCVPTSAVWWSCLKKRASISTSSLRISSAQRSCVRACVLACHGAPSTTTRKTQTKNRHKADRTAA